MQRSGSSPSRLYCSSLFCECLKFCDLAKQRRKIFWGVSEVGKNDFSLYSCWRCVVFLVLYYSSAAIARHLLSSHRVIITHAGLHEGIERVFVAVVSARRRFPAGRALWRSWVWFPGPLTLRGSQVGPVAAPLPAPLHRRDAPGPPRGRRRRDLQVVPHGLMVG